MPSTRETIGLVAFASRIPVVFVRTEMKKHLLAAVDPSGEFREAEDEFVFALEDLRRKPDAVAVLDSEISKAAGLPEKPHILFVEVEFSAPIIPTTLIE